MIRVLVWAGFVLGWPAVTLASDAGGGHPGAGLAPWLVTGALVVALGILGGLRLLRRSTSSSRDVPPRTGHSQFDPVLPRQYSPLNVGNDASARPWERQGAVESSANGLLVEGKMAGASALPEGFDAQAFLSDSKANFIGLQAAWDRADVPTLRAMMTEGMLSEIQGQLAEREQTGGSADVRSEVIMIEAQLLGIEELVDSYTASVEFSGLVREGSGAGPNPFRELWSITRPKTGEGRWLVAGVQALQ